MMRRKYGPLLLLDIYHTFFVIRIYYLDRYHLTPWLMSNPSLRLRIARRIETETAGSLQRNQHGHHNTWAVWRCSRVL
jgi:hypothetical protein